MEYCGYQMNYKFKNQWPICLCSLIAASVFTGSAWAQLADGGFETGNFSSGKLELPRVASVYQSGKIPVGTAQVLSTSAQLGHMTPARTAKEGNIFAVLGSLGFGNFPGHRTFNMNLSQKASLDEHDSVSGWASFLNVTSNHRIAPRSRFSTPRV